MHSISIEAVKCVFVNNGIRDLNIPAIAIVHGNQAGICVIHYKIAFRIRRERCDAQAGEHGEDHAADKQQT